MNETRPSNKTIKIDEPTKIQQCSGNCNVDLKSFFQQLAQDNGVKGFSLVSDNAASSRHDVKRHSAPPIINGATRKILSNDAAPSYPPRRTSDGDYDQPSNLSFLATIFDEVLDTVSDEVESVLREVEEEDDDQSIVSTDFSNRNHALQQDPHFDSSFQRFSVDPSSCDESQETSSRSSASLREQMVAPRLPVRKESITEFGSLGSTSILSSDSFRATSTFADRTLKAVPMTLPQTAMPLSAPESPHSQAHSWQHKGVDHQYSASAPATSHIMDMSQDVWLSPLQDKASKYGRRRRRRSSRRNSLDTGFTFRTSFSSKNGEQQEDDDEEDIFWIE